jgi:hypothetical protein
VKLDVAEEYFQARYAELVKFKERYGHANIPAIYPPDQQLATWLRNQRRGAQECSIPVEHGRLLGTLGVELGIKPRGTCQKFSVNMGGI